MMAPESLPPTPRDRLDEILWRLHVRQSDWVRVGLRERADFLEACVAGVGRVAREWVRRSCLAQGIEPDSRLAGELWLSGPAVTVRCLRRLAESLRRRAAPEPPELRRRGERWVATVTPDRNLEKMLYRGYVAEQWILPGMEPSQGAIYRRKAAGELGRGGIGLALGAGNVAGIAPRDLAHKLFVEDEVVVLKMHPVNEYLGPLLEEAFSSLIEAGYLAVVYGDAEVGQVLCRHDLVDSIHLTGSHRTHDAIVWGDSEAERERRKASGEPLIDKRVTSELGCVTPVIVVPGEWTRRQLDTQARHVAGMIVNNAGFNCNAAKLIVTHADWPQRQRFLERLEAALEATPLRPAYYPGAEERHARFVEAYPDAEMLGGPPGEGSLPWVLAAGIDAGGGAKAFRDEAFCGFTAETPIEAADPGEFLSAAVRLCNREVWGSLSCMLVVDDATASELGGELDRAVEGLRYGGVAVNAWSGYLFGLATTSWGAYPGNSLDDIGSGIGTVGNTYLFDHPEKSVIRGPFTPWPKPPWFPDHRTLNEVGRRFTRMEGAPAWHRLPGLVLAAARA